MIVSLKSGVRHEGIVNAIIAEGDAAGVTLKDCRDLSNPASAVRESLVLPASNIASWNPRMTNGADCMFFFGFLLLFSLLEMLIFSLSRSFPYRHRHF